MKLTILSVYPKHAHPGISLVSFEEGGYIALADSEIQKRFIIKGMVVDFEIRGTYLPCAEDIADAMIEKYTRETDGWVLRLKEQSESDRIAAVTAKMCGKK